VLINLLTNAMEAGRAKRRGKMQVIVRTRAPDRDVVLVEVADSGGGIPADRMPHIFDPFFTTKSTGTGLGLSLSRAIVEEHGGRIWASSAPDDGATFHVQLPVRNIDG